MFKVFVSYAQPQLALATHLRSSLSGRGVETYVAEHDLAPGGSLSESIGRAIASADLFLLLWTAAAAASEYVGKEVFLAKTSARPIIPLQLEPGVALPLELGDIKYLDVGRDPQAQLAWLKEEVARRAQDKTISDFVALSLIGFLAWYVLSRSQ